MDKLYKVKLGAILILLLSALAGILLSGCTNMLPSEESRQKYPWATFTEIKTAYDNIEIGGSDINDIKEQGFDPDTTSNISILNYLDVVKRFSPILEKEDLPEGIQQCIKAKEQCISYVASPSNIHKDRVGNAAMDLLGFRKETITKGWRFEAVFVMVDNTVTYKLWNGTPDIEEYNRKVIPLGPAQSIGNLLSP